MAHLNHNLWNHHPPPPQSSWGNFHGSNMSLNLPSQHHFMPSNEWNPWMQQQYPYPYPMPNGMR